MSYGEEDTCFMLAGLRRMCRCSNGIVDASNATAPATTGDATDVPLSERQPLCVFMYVCVCVRGC